MFLQISNLKKNFGGYQAVHNFAMDIDKGEFVSFLGPSGCGKTTTLRMVAGFETPSDGAIRIANQDITRLRPNQRKIGMVFQSYALFPNMTVAENVAFGLKVARKPAAEIKTRVEEMLALIKLPHLGGRYPYQLSGAWRSPARSPQSPRCSCSTSPSPPSTPRSACPFGKRSGRCSGSSASPRST
jgi:putative spermidine/putrescine transport system ATP-binding protein